MGFPDSSAGEESACNAGDPSSIPGSGRSPGEGIGYTLQFSWASLVAQLVKNRPAMQESWVQSVGWEDPQEKGKATHSNTLAGRIPWTSPWGHKESDTAEWLSLGENRMQTILYNMYCVRCLVAQLKVEYLHYNFVFNFIYLFLGAPAVCGILFPQPGIKLMPSALEAWSQLLYHQGSP